MVISEFDLLVFAVLNLLELKSFTRVFNITIRFFCFCYGIVSYRYLIKYIIKIANNLIMVLATI